MLRSLPAVLAGISFPIAGWAQTDLKVIWDSDPRIGSAAVNVRNVIGTVALAVVATDLCSVGDRKPWLTVLMAVDNRYAFCIDQDPKWRALTYGLEQELEEASRKGQPTGVGALFFMRAMQARGSRAVAQGASFCGETPWKMMLDPKAVTAEQIEADKRVAPNGEIEKALAVMVSVLSLGKDTGWVYRPCDKEFWPTAFTLNK